MTRKNLDTIIIVVIIIIGLVTVFVAGGVGQFFKDTYNKIKPIYRECRIEGKNFNSVQPSDCKNFSRKIKNQEIPDGEYNVFAKYIDRTYGDNIIPIQVKDHELSCTYLANGYTPVIDVFYNTSGTGSSPVPLNQASQNGETPVGSDGLLVQINYQKNGELYFYDTNICEMALRSTIYDAEKKELGKTGFNAQNFIVKGPRYNQIMINNNPYFYRDNQVIRNFKAGNIYAKINFFPDQFFKFTIPCSWQKITVITPDIETSKNLLIPFKGLNPEYITTCGSKLYLTLQNTNQKNDLQGFEDLQFENNDAGIMTYKLPLQYIERVVDPETRFPVSFKLELRLADKSAAKGSPPLASSTITITGYNENIIDYNQNPLLPSTEKPADDPAPDPILETEASPEIQQKPILSTETRPAAPVIDPPPVSSETRPKVKRNQTVTPAGSPGQITASS
jgi:hypothetical protein